VFDYLECVHDLGVFDYFECVHDLVRVFDYLECVHDLVKTREYACLTYFDDSSLLASVMVSVVDEVQHRRL